MKRTLSSLAIAVFGFLVWAHHLFVAGISPYSAMVFSFLTYAVAVPSAVKVFNWTATLYKGSVWLATPMLYALGFIGLFTLGGLTGLFLATLSGETGTTSLDAMNGLVTRAEIGACVQVPGYDLARISTDVEYRDNGSNLDTTTLPVPPPTPPPVATP